MFNNKKKQLRKLFLEFNSMYSSALKTDWADQVNYINIISFPQLQAAAKQ